MNVTRTNTIRFEFTDKEVQEILQAHIAKTVPEVKKMKVSDTATGCYDMGESSCGSMIEFEGS